MTRRHVPTAASALPPERPRPSSSPRRPSAGSPTRRCRSTAGWDTCASCGSSGPTATPVSTGFTRHERDTATRYCAGATCGQLAPFLASDVDNPMNTVDKGPPGAVSVDKPPVPRASIADVWRVPLAVWRARKALDRGDLVVARTLVAPLLDRFGTVTLVRKIAAEVLYASGDPLSAASLFEQVAKKLTGDRVVAVGLVASYAALNRAGDARRSAALLPENVEVRLALAWSELAALGGDPNRGSAL